MSKKKTAYPKKKNMDARNKEIAQGIRKMATAGISAAESLKNFAAATGKLRVEKKAELTSNPSPCQ